MRDFAYFVFREPSQGKLTTGKLLLRKAPQKIGLVLGGIEGTQKLIAPSGGFEANARVVAGGEAIGADLAGHAKQRFKLHIGIAVGTGDRRPAAQVVVDKRPHHVLLKLLLEVDDIVSKIEMLRDALGVVNVVKRTAAVLCGAVALKLGQAALIPKLHGEADDRTALLPEDGGDGRRVDAAGHGDGDEPGLRLCARGWRRFVWCCLRHDLYPFRAGEGMTVPGPSSVVPGALSVTTARGGERKGLGLTFPAVDQGHRHRPRPVHPVFYHFRRRQRSTQPLAARANESA